MNTRNAGTARLNPDSPVLLLPPATIMMLPTGPCVSEEDFADIVQTALEAVGGTFLFKDRIAVDDRDEHVAAAFVDDGNERQFVLLSLDAAGGRLRVETVSGSERPLARIAESYAGLLDAFNTAA